MRGMWLILLLTALLAGCGGGDEEEAPDVEADALSGIEARAPESVASCLEEAGFTVQAEDEAPEAEDATALGQLTIGDRDGSGTGAITWYATEQEAVAAHRAELDEQVPDTVVGRKGNATYVFAGGEFTETGREIEGCL